MQQGSQEWFNARCGMVTASRVSDVIAKTKSGYSTSRQNYLAQLVAERLTGQPVESYSNAAMEWGTQQEPFARAMYESNSDVLVDQVGFVLHPTIDCAGASPDGLVGDGLVEIKCPNTATHLDYLLGKVVPSKYKPQMAWQMACTGRKWCDFVSYDPRLPQRHQLFVVRYTPEEGYIESLEEEVRKFLEEVDNVIQQLNGE